MIILKIKAYNLVNSVIQEELDAGLLAESYECDIFNVVPEGFDSKIYKKIKRSDLEQKLC